MEAPLPPGPANPTPPSYVTDVIFPSGYINFQEPMLLSFVAASRGIVPPDPTGGFRFLELGCGDGRSLNVLAAANPAAEFVGIDFNPEHIRLAQRSAEEAALDNVRYVESRFTDVASTAISTFDYVAIHGTYSWLDPESRTALHEILRTCLKPGGCFFVDHMCLPGKAAIAPVWYLLRKLSGDGGDSLSRVRKGMAALATVQEAEARYFIRNGPATEVLRRFLDRIGTQENAVRQLAHHALSEQWNPEYFTDIRDRFRAIGLEFAGSTWLAMNDDEVVLPEELREIAGESDDPGVIELLKDYFLDQQNRKDVFVKDPTYDPGTARSFRNESLDVVLLESPAMCRQRLAEPESGQVDPTVDDIALVLDRLSDGRAKVGDFIDERGAEDDQVGHLPHALLRLLDRRLAVLGDAKAMANGRTADKSIRLASPFNALALEAAAARGQPAILASPVSGGGVWYSALVTAVLTHMVGSGTSDVRLRTLTEWLRSLPVQYGGGDGRTGAADLGRSKITTTRKRVERDVVPNLIALGVLSRS